MPSPQSHVPNQDIGFNYTPAFGQQGNASRPLGYETSTTTNRYDQSQTSQPINATTPSLLHYDNGTHLPDPHVANLEQSRYNEFSTSRQHRPQDAHSTGSNFPTSLNFMRQVQPENRNRVSTSVEQMMNTSNFARPPYSNVIVQHKDPLEQDQTLRAPPNVSDLKIKDRAPHSSKQKKLLCFHCATTYGSPTTLQNHFRLTHLGSGLLHSGTEPPDIAIVFWACGLCTKEGPFPSSDVLIKHVVADHSHKKAEFCGWDFSKHMHNLLCHDDLREIYQTLLSREPLGPVHTPVWNKSSEATDILRLLQRGAFIDPRAVHSPQDLVEMALGCATEAKIPHNYLSSRPERAFQNPNSPSNHFEHESSFAGNSETVMHNMSPSGRDNQQQNSLSSDGWDFSQYTTSAQVSDSNLGNSYTHNRSFHASERPLHDTNAVTYAQISTRRVNSPDQSSQPGGHGRQRYFDGVP